MNNTTDRIRRVMADVLGIPAADIPDDAAPGVLEAWDSLRHMNLIAALEDEFGFRFSDDEMSALLSVPLIVHVVSAKETRA
jgi:acyl carrier protein